MANRPFLILIFGHSGAQRWGPECQKFKTKNGRLASLSSNPLVTVPILELWAKRVKSSSKVKHKGQSSWTQEENGTKVVGSTSSKVFLVIIIINIHIKKMQELVGRRFGRRDACTGEQSSSPVNAGQPVIPTCLDLDLELGVTGSHWARRLTGWTSGSGGNQDSRGASPDSSRVARRTGVLADSTTNSATDDEKRQSVCTSTYSADQRVPAATARAPADWHRGRPENRVGSNWQLVPRQLRFGPCRHRIF